MDSNSLGVLTTLGFDILGGLLIAMGWLLMRKCRGDKKDVRATQARDEGLTRTNMLFVEDTEIDLAKRYGEPSIAVDSTGAQYNGRVSKVPNKQSPLL